MTIFGKATDDGIGLRVEDTPFTRDQWRYTYSLVIPGGAGVPSRVMQCWPSAPMAKLMAKAEKRNDFDALNYLKAKLAHTFGAPVPRRPPNVKAKDVGESD